VSELIRLAVLSLTSLDVLVPSLPSSSSSSASRRLTRCCFVALLGSSPSSVRPNRSSLHVLRLHPRIDHRHVLSGTIRLRIHPDVPSSRVLVRVRLMSIPLLRVRIVRPMHHVETSPLASVTRACEVPLLTRMSPGSTQRGAQDSRGKGRDQALRQVKPTLRLNKVQWKLTRRRQRLRRQDAPRPTVPNPSSRDNT